MNYDELKEKYKRVASSHVYEQSLRTAIGGLAHRHPRLSVDSLFDQLSAGRPQVKRRELKVLYGEDPNSLRDSGMEPLDSEVLRIFAEHSGKKSGRSLRRLETEFFLKVEVFSPGGRPKFAYEDLVFELIGAIETATGHRMTLTIDPYDESGRAKGLYFNVLWAALEVHLFASMHTSTRAIERAISRYKSIVYD